MKEGSFEQRKKAAVIVACDNSLKKSIDQSVLPICDVLNNSKDYFTTSSCSGRIVLYREHKGKEKDSSKNPWILISHDPISYNQLQESISLVSSEEASVVYFKFEPMIMHIEARDVDQAQKLLSVAVQSGFRNSGISIGKNRIIVAIRCTLKLDVPLILEFDGSFGLGIKEEYVRWLVDLGNEKMVANNALIMRLYQSIKNSLLI